MEETQQSTAVVPAAQVGVALPEAEMEGAWGAENASSADLVIPRLLLQQGLSDFVKQRKAQAGDIVHSLSGKIVGNDVTPCAVIPFAIASKQWFVEEEIDGTWEFKEKVQWGPANANWEREELVNGILTRRTLALDFLCLMADDVEGLPCLISFRKTSYKTGKALSSHFTLSGKLKKPPARLVFNLGCHEESKDKNSWFVFDVTESRPSTQAELTAAYSWWKLLQTTKYKVDEAKAVEGEEAPF